MLPDTPVPLICARVPCHVARTLYLFSWSSKVPSYQHLGRVYMQEVPRMVDGITSHSQVLKLLYCVQTYKG